MSDTDHAESPARELELPGFSGTLRMHVHDSGDAFISQSITERGIWEEDETRFMMEVLQAGDVFVDVGANIGYFTLIASALVGSEGEVLAFEPEQQNFVLLKANCELNQCANVICVHAGLGTEDTEDTLYLSDTNQGDHALLPRERGARTQNIRILNGTKAIRERRRRVGFIKIDTQGYEWHVLKGLREVIEDSLPGLIMLVEFSPVKLRQAGVSGQALLTELQQLPHVHLYLMDQRQGGLLAMSIEEMISLSAFTEQNPVEEEANLIISGHPLDEVPGFPLINDLGIYENPLPYLLLGDRLEPWSGEPADLREGQNHFYLPEGWAFPEDWGRWSLGHRSRIKFITGEALRQHTGPRLCIRARYFGDIERTGVQVDEYHLGDHDLREADIPLPVELMVRDHLTITFSHAKPQRPCDLGSGGDDRPIKLGLESIAIGA